MDDPYKTLNISRTATQSEIKKAYQKHILRCHPDRVKGGPEAKKKAEEQFKKIQSAYEILSDEQKRKEYDTFGRVGSQGAQGVHDFSQFFTDGQFGNIFDFGNFRGTTSFRTEDFQGAFGDVFGDAFGRKRRATQEVKVRLSLDELYNGITKKVCVNVRRDNARVAEFNVDVKPWYKSGTKFTYEGAGDATRTGYKDVVITVEEIRNPFFTRSGDDLEYVFRTGLKELVTMNKNVYLPGGRVYNLRWADVKVIGDFFVVKGMGMRRKKGGHGDLKVKVIVDVDVGTESMDRISRAVR
ncbi:Molecular chaperone (DnaJ superfamily) [Trachipleistophora hominis]|uniref:Molecular chaperone (DnaJ superfamily) n=1 Tax=Trachipleistophora hominis TaxID=72359 RepID=L7JWQ2_TRAHO|nr:Molecular chaperone (DnaJ superfamily) [Trachipleistophora hominis]